MYNILMLKAFNNKSTYASLGLFILTILLSSILISPPSSAETTTVDASVNVPVSCSLSGTGMNSHNADVPNGTYQADIGITTLKAMCNDSEGFAIYAIGYTGDQYLGDDHTKLIGTSTNQKITTSTATSGSTSSWAMKLAAVSSPTPVYPITLDNGYGSYSSIPDTYTKVAHRDSGTDVGTNATGAQLTTTYASFISSTQVADNYSGKVKYTLVHPADNTPKDGPMACESGKICYSPSASNVIGTMGKQTISLEKDWSQCYETDFDTYCLDDMYEYIDPDTLPNLDYLLLLASNYSREGYGFAGWSNTIDYGIDSNARFYGPQESITPSSDDILNGLTLYAVWVPSVGSLQDSTKVAELCGTGANSLTTAPTNGTANLASVSALTDQRDGETYAIAKLADGKCWMIENLRLEADDTIAAEDIALSQGYDSSFIGLATAESDNFFMRGSTTANSLYSIDGSTTMTISGSNQGYRFPRYNNLNTPSDASNRPQDPTSNTFLNDNTTGMYSYGNYYTWAATVADTTYSGGDHDTTSICPKGWQVPLGNVSAGDIDQGASDAANRVPGFSYLDRKLGGTGAQRFGTDIALQWRSFPNNFLYSGSFQSSSALNRGHSGDYWSSTSAGYYAYDLRFSPNGLYPASSNYYKPLGYSVRCVLEL